MGESDRRNAWDLLFVTNVNVCYWKSSIERNERWFLRGEIAVLVVGLGVAIIVYVAQQEAVRTIVTAVFTALAAFVGGPLVKHWRTSEARTGHKCWSEFCSDAEALWREGEDKQWRGATIKVRIAALLEREKQYQARDYHIAHAAELKNCEDEARLKMTSRYQGNYH